MSTHTRSVSRRPVLALLASTLVFTLVFIGGSPLAALVEGVPFAVPLLWPEEQRAFLQDGPGLLLGEDELKELLDLDAVGRQRFIDAFLADDPLPATPENELAQAIDRRRALVRSEIPTWLDDRARVLFLHGRPVKREAIDCAEVYQPLELWTYTNFGTPRTLVFYRPKPDEAWRLWLPIDSKRVLYNAEMEYYLEQWEELRGKIFGGRRFDRSICDDSERIDRITGVDGLFGFLPERPKNADVAVYRQPPDDLAAWAAPAAATDAPAAAPLPPVELELYFPERQRLRVVTRALLKLPADAEYTPYVEGEKKELRFRVEGHTERAGKIFDSFRLRFQLPLPAPGNDKPIGLVVNRPLRPNEEFLLRLKVVEETSGREAYLNRGFAVPPDARPLDVPPVADEALLAISEDLGKERIEGYDSLVLLPPETDVVFGLWRAEALVTGTRIAKVAFLLDGAPVMTRRRPPFTAELRLETYPKEQIVRAEGYDEQDQLVSIDEVILNQPRGELQVRVLEPGRGSKVPPGPFAAQAEVVVPEEKRVTAVTFLVNEEVQATLERPPWEATVEVPATGELSYLTVTAELDDGTTAEAVRFLNAPDFIEEVDVDLVELYTTVTDKSGRLVRDLAATDFKVWEDDRPQEIAKFELVEDLPLTLGIAIDVSGSMYESLGQAKRAAIGFLENVITPRDRCFALAFADRPVLLMGRTSDVGAVAERLDDLLANGSTALHDAIVTSLYYYRGLRGRRALVLLSDGEDTTSTIDFGPALEYARRSGVAVYTIGLRISRLDVGIRRKLDNLATETGGRAFYISEAAELADVYEDIEEELRSQYLIAYNSDQDAKDDSEYREVKVEVKDGKLEARTLRGYYP